MATTTITKLDAQKRGAVGSHASTAERTGGRVPGVLYGRGFANLHFTLDRRKLDDVLRHQAKLVQIAIAGVEPVHALIQDLQHDVITHAVLHIDARVVRLDEKIEVRVPVEPMGIEMTPGVAEGGSLELHLHELLVSCFPHEIPDRITIDVSDLKIGDVKRVSAAVVPAGVTIVTAGDEVLVSVVQPVDVAAETNVEASLKELEGAEPTVLTAKPDEEGAEGAAKDGKGAAKADGKGEAKADGKGEAKEKAPAKEKGK
ncbi:MAG: 50S ribosomal protein L25 [Planctomycetota bacterium]